MKPNVINTQSPDWIEVRRALHVEMSDLLTDLQAMPEPGKRDNSDFIRGRLFQINELLAIEPDEKQPPHR